MNSLSPHTESFKSERCLREVWGNLWKLFSRLQNSEKQQTALLTWAWTFEVSSRNHGRLPRIRFLIDNFSFFLEHRVVLDLVATLATLVLSQQPWSTSSWWLLFFMCAVTKSNRILLMSILQKLWFLKVLDCFKLEFSSKSFMKAGYAHGVGDLIHNSFLLVFFYD